MVMHANDVETKGKTLPEIKKLTATYTQGCVKKDYLFLNYFHKRGFFQPY